MVKTRTQKQKKVRQQKGQIQILRKELGLLDASDEALWKAYRTALGDVDTAWGALSDCMSEVDMNDWDCYAGDDGDFDPATLLELLEKIADERKRIVALYVAAML